MDLIKNNVIDVVEDSKRQCVEFQCQSNKSGKEVIEYLRSTLPEGVIKEVRYLFGTRDFEIETYTKKQTSELYKSVNDVLTGKVSHFASAIMEGLTMVKDFGTTVIGGKQQASVEKEKAKYEAEAAIAKANADAQVRALETKNKVIYFGVGGALLIVAAILFVVFKK